jgi:hypothetical protein
MSSSKIPYPHKAPVFVFTDIENKERVPVYMSCGFWDSIQKKESIQSPDSLSYKLPRGCEIDVIVPSPPRDSNISKTILHVHVEGRDTYTVELNPWKRLHTFKLIE